MQLIIRTLSADDSSAINCLSAQLGYPGSIDETRNRISEVICTNDHLALVAIESGEIRGWIHAFKCITIEAKPFI